MRKTSDFWYTNKTWSKKKSRTVVGKKSWWRRDGSELCQHWLPLNLHIMLTKNKFKVNPRRTWIQHQSPKNMNSKLLWIVYAHNSGWDSGGTHDPWSITKLSWVLMILGSLLNYSSWVPVVSINHFLSFLIPSPLVQLPSPNHSSTNPCCKTHTSLISLVERHLNGF
jgi:hypothetical protein